MIYIKRSAYLVGCVSCIFKKQLPNSFYRPCIVQHKPKTRSSHHPTPNNLYSLHDPAARLNKFSPHYTQCNTLNGAPLVRRTGRLVEGGIKRRAVAKIQDVFSALAGVGCSIIVFGVQAMEEQIEIIELSELSKEEIVREVLQLLNHNEIKKLTLMVKRVPLAQNSMKQEFNYTLEETGFTISTSRPKSSTIDRYYHTSNFRLQSKEISLFPEDEELSYTHSIMPNSPKDLGIKLYKEGEYQNAIEIFEELREHFPQQNKEEMFQKEYRQILTFLANSYYRLKQYAKAIESYKEVLRVPEEIEERALGQLHNNLGCCYAKVGCEKLSMDSYSEAIKVYSRFREVDCSLLMANIANIYSNCQMYAVAEKYYSDAIAERKNKAPKKKEMMYQIYRKLSLSQQELRKYPEALDSLERALEISEQGYGNIIEVLYQSARLKEKMEQWSQALDDYEKIHLFYDSQGLNKGVLYEKAAKIHDITGKQAECAKYIVLAVEEYRKEKNERKVSELSSHRYVKNIIL